MCASRNGRAGLLALVLGGLTCLSVEAAQQPISVSGDDVVGGIADIFGKKKKPKEVLGNLFLRNLLNNTLKDSTWLQVNNRNQLQVDPLKALLSPQSKAFNSMPTATDKPQVVRLTPLVSQGPANYQALTNASENDRVLYQYRLALWEMRQGNPAAAQDLFRAALETVDNRFGKDKNTERASKLFHNEAEKTFVGEPYERAMANVYYGFLQLAASQTNEARASFKSAEWEDSWTVTKTEQLTNQSDFVLPYYLRGLGVAKEDGTLMYDATTNACKLFTAPPAYAYDPSHNVVLLIDYGTGPQKYLAGKDGHELQFYDGTANFKSVRITVDTNSTTVSAGPYDDITFQAITRGGRVMDHVNKRKSQVKEGAKVVGWGAIIASAASAAAGVDSRVAAGVMVGGMLLQVASNQIQPKADARCWDNLPQFVTCATLALPPGQHVAKVEFLDTSNNVGLTKTVKLDVAENQFCAAYVSEFSTQ